MKTFKKSLCLVLALVMVLGVCMVGASAAVTYETYTDAAAVAANTYADAINLVTDLKFMEGDETGNFNADKGLTRAEAAKLIAYVKLDASYAAQLSKISSDTGFKDVPASHWASGYISYCKKLGIINGYSDTEFGPEDPVTGIQFAKMLLAAKGYGAKDEYVGEGWDIAVWTDATLQKLLITGVETDAQVKRGEAAQYIANTLTYVKPVTFNATTGTYTEGATYVAANQIYTKYALVMANAATDANTYGYTTVALHDGTKFDAVLKLTGIAGDETLIGHELQITYNAASKVCYVANDVTTAVAAADAAKLTTAQKDAAIKFDNFNYDKDADVDPAASYLKLATGEYVALTTDYKVSYIKAVVEKSATVAEAYAVVCDVAGDVNVKGDFSAYKTSLPYVKYYYVGEVAKLEVLETEVVTLTSYNNTTKAFNGLTKAVVETSLKSGVTAYADQAALGNQATLLKVGTAYVAALPYTAAVVDTNEYVYLVAKYVTSNGKDAYGQDVAASYYAQCVTAAGEIVNYQITEAAYKDTGLVKGVYAITETTAGYKTFTAASKKVEIAIKAAGSTKFAEADGYTYYVANGAFNALTKATGAEKAELSGLKVTANVAVSGYKAGTIYAVYADTTYAKVRNIVSAWVVEPENKGADTPSDVANSYIYVAKAAAASYEYVTGVGNVPLYDFYLDGELKTAQKLSTTISQTGFYTYHVDEKGQYVLAYAGQQEVACTVTVSAQNATNYIMNGKLNAASPAFNEADISALKVVDLRTNPTTKIDSVDALTTAQMTAAVTFTVVYSTVGTVHPVGVIYVIDTPVA